MKKSFPHFKQPDLKDCGPTCLKIIAQYFGRNITLTELREISETTRLGSNLHNLSAGAEQIGFRTLGVRINISALREITLPCILHWNENHYVVLYKIKNNGFYISDPAFGLIKYTEREFEEMWINGESVESTGVALIIEPTPNFYKNDFNDNDQKFNYSYLTKYLLKYRKFLYQLIYGLIAGSLLQLVVPFLTQSVVDVGIKNQDINFVYLILFAQIALFIGRSAIEVIRSWILLHLSTRINISLISDFFIKLMKLPIAFFDAKMTGDILQRINDHQRIEQILTTSSLSVLFSLINFIIFSLVLAYYNLEIFAIFLIGSALYFAWILIFLKRRKELDYKRFAQVSNEQSTVIELINGMQEIKLHNAEREKRWKWELVQAKLFNISIKNLALEQYQSVGSSLINELKNIIITVLSAKLVIEGEITLGMMLAISYIVGQLNSPIQQFIIFIRQLQDANISLERLSEIHNKLNEDEDIQDPQTAVGMREPLVLNSLSFRYKGTNNLVLKDINICIPPNKITAIVGSSGSGKTTLMKLLLKFYHPTSGEISIGDFPLRTISSQWWRSVCGVVMQDGYIFNDTVSRNIAVGDDIIDKEKLKKAAKLANIYEFIESLSSKFETSIGMEGLGLSAGQRQRILIARAIYKNPAILFFDEATSALDANNEKEISENLNSYLKSKTAVIIAHRLSTVKNADQIIVLEAGKIMEIGCHNELIANKSYYFKLVKNQLELGN